MRSNTSSADPPQPLVERGSLLGRGGMQRVILMFFFAFLIVQLVTPVAQLIGAHRPARFGWQMFSVISMPPEFTIVRADGTAERMDVAPFVSSFRADVPLTQFLPAHLCQVVPHVVAVRYRLHDQPVLETYVCNV